MGLDGYGGIVVGSGTHGKRNLITDVKGVQVGHCTLSQEGAQTGVTAILPHTGDIFHEKVMAAAHVFNGFGKSMGLVQLEEMGNIETPIVLTNTLSVGTAYDAVVRYMLERNKDIGDTTGTVNPIVCECNDGEINNIRGLYVTRDHVRQALACCGEDFEEGAVGAGRGMRCHQCKGGIGSSSRLVKISEHVYTLGALVLTNHGLWKDLVIQGQPVGKEIPMEDVPYADADKGSCIIILATDIPLSERQLKRVCRRSIVGLNRLGSYMSNGSGEICIAFTTANRIPHDMNQPLLPLEMLHDECIDLVFRAAAEAVEEAVLSSLFHGYAMADRHGNTVFGLKDMLRKNK